jgi:hypothetical protein
MQEKIEWIERYGKQAQGKNELIRSLYGEKLTLNQAVKAHCYECMGYYIDGKVDCKVPECSLYFRMPFREGGVAKMKKGKKKVGATEEQT